MGSDYIVELRKISKYFPGVVALRGVTLGIKQGEILGLVGENGAGKSTLMRILSGAIIPDEGEIYIEGQKVRLASPRDARNFGIYMVQQELSLIPSLSVEDNIVLGSESKRTFGVLDGVKNNIRTAEALKIVNLQIDSSVKVESLSLAVRQLIEIARNVSQNPKILVLDEPTTAISADDVERLFSVLKDLKEKGVTVVLITHQIEEILRIADRVAVLRDGQLVDIFSKGVTREEIIFSMIGQSLDNFIPEHESKAGHVLLKVEGATIPGKFYGISLSVHEGEIVGIFGLKGAGKSELALAIFGALPLESGRIVINGEEALMRCPLDAIKKGIGFLTEDRKATGLFLDLPIRDNMVAASYDKLISKLGVIDLKTEKEIARKYIIELGIKTPTIIQKVKLLSGGNQQKVLIARWLLRESRVLILDEPTRGIDVGAKHEVYLKIEELAYQNKGIVLISSEIDEILRLSGTIVVMKEGRFKGIFRRNEVTRETLMALAAG